MTFSYITLRILFKGKEVNERNVLFQLGPTGDEIRKGIIITYEGKNWLVDTTAQDRTPGSMKEWNV